MNTNPHPAAQSASVFSNGIRIGILDIVRNDSGRSITAERMVELYDACAGMADPAAEIARLRECERACQNALAWMGQPPSDDDDSPNANSSRALIEQLSAVLDGKVAK